MKLRILHLEDDPMDAELVREALSTQGLECEIVNVDSRDTFMTELKNGSYDLVMADFSLPSFDGISALKLTRQHNPEIPFILISGTVGEEIAVEALKEGATDYIMKERLYRLPVAILRSLKDASERGERKQTQEALRKSESLFRTISEESPLGILLTNPNGQSAYMNPRCMEITGLNYESASGRGWVDFIHPEDRERVRMFWENVIESRAASESVHRFVKNGNEIVWVRLKVAPMKGENEFLGFVGVLEDITEHRRRDEELRTAEAKYRNLVEKAPAIVYMAEFGAAGRWLYVSPQVQKMLGYSQAELLTDAAFWFNHLHPEDQSRVMMDEERSRKTGEPFISEYRVFASDGNVVWLRDEATILNNPTMIQGVLTDITRLKRAEEEKAKLEKQYLHAQKMEAVGQLAGGMAHDFNNLLMAISGYCELMHLTMKQPGQSTDHVNEIQKAVERGSSLIRQLLTFARNQVVEMKVLDLNEVIRHMETLLQRLLGSDIELLTELQDSLPRIRADNVQIEQVIMNLAVNARDAMPQGGKLVIRTAERPAEENRPVEDPESRRHVALSIIDSGVGMDEETQAHIFEPFYTTKGKDKGTGLGLATVYGIVKQSGAQIYVHSEPGIETNFTITFPCVDTGDTRKSTAGEQKEPQSGSETILFVDDNESVLKPLSTLLESVGYNVLRATSGKAALELAERKNGIIHLLISDMIMPGMTGRELAAQLKSMRPELKILFLTGFSPDTSVPMEKDATLLQKPVTIRVLLERVRHLLD